MAAAAAREAADGGDINGGGGGGGERSSSPAAAAAGNSDVGRVAVRRMFAFADGADAALMAVGAAAAVANGMAQPLMTFIFGDVINAFGSTSSPDVLAKVTKVRACLLRALLLLPRCCHLTHRSPTAIAG